MTGSLIDVDTAAVGAGVTPRTIRRWIASGWLTGTTTTRGWRTTTQRVEQAQTKARIARQRRAA